MADRERSGGTSEPERRQAGAARPPSAPARSWRVRGRELALGRPPLVLAIVNVTPDSFSDGGRHATADAAVAHALRLADEGADLLDVGGESTRPGSGPVPLDEERRRVLPVVEALARRTPLPLSVDTSKAALARECLACGAHIINDVTALAGDPGMPEAVRSTGAGAVLMHMRGTPATMQDDPQYDDVVNDILAFFEARLRALAAAGLDRDCLAVDPGIGFGKTVGHNLEILARLGELGRLGLPVCLGASRKGFIGKVLGRDLGGRLAGSLAVVCHAAVLGTAQIVRVHDVAETRDVLRMLEAIWGSERPA